MLASILSALSHSVEGTSVLAAMASFAWGVLSILLSPCHLSSIPLIVGFINGQGRIPTKKALYISTLFSLGLLVSIAAIAAITNAAGRMIGDVGKWGTVFVASVFFLVGLNLLDVIPMPWSGPGQPAFSRKGAWAAFVLGLVFGIALGPCTFAYMAPMLTVVFQTASTRPWYGALLLASYGIGHCAVIVVAGTFTEVVERYLGWNERSGGSAILKRLCGALVILGGIYLIYTTF